MVPCCVYIRRCLSFRCNFIAIANSGVAIRKQFPIFFCAGSLPFGESRSNRPVLPWRLAREHRSRLALPLHCCSARGLTMAGVRRVPHAWAAEVGAATEPQVVAALIQKALGGGAYNTAAPTGDGIGVDDIPCIPEDLLSQIMAGSAMHHITLQAKSKSKRRGPKPQGCSQPHSAEACDKPAASPKPAMSCHVAAVKVEDKAAPSPPRRMYGERQRPAKRARGGRLNTAQYEKRCGV